ncbi:MAG: ribosome silencing factor [Nitrospiraceae bacterium]|nr:ribosome silencing factor [Nitrospiraceae bacterium]
MQEEKKGPSAESREKALAIAQFALDKKAGDVVVLEMHELTSFTDFFVICSGESTTQVKTIAEHVIESLKAKKIRPSGTEGLSNAKWVLVDYNDVVVHVFEKDTRQFYELEKLWLDAPRVSVS